VGESYLDIEQAWLWRRFNICLLCDLCECIELYIVKELAFALIIRKLEDADAYVEQLCLRGPGLDRPGLVVEFCEFCGDHVCY
jgi:hypothetical protein